MYKNNYLLILLSTIIIVNTAVGMQKESIELIVAGKSFTIPAEIASKANRIRNWISEHADMPVIIGEEISLATMKHVVKILNIFDKLYTKSELTGNALFNAIEKEIDLKKLPCLELLSAFEYLDFAPGIELFARFIAKNDDILNLFYIDELSPDADVKLQNQFALAQKIKALRHVIACFETTPTIKLKVKGLKFKVFKIPRAIALKAKTIKEFISNESELTNTTVEIFSIPIEFSFSSEVMDLVVKTFEAFHESNTSQLTQNQLLDIVEQKIQLNKKSPIFELLHAFKYLQFDQGIDLIARYIAKNDDLLKIFDTNSAPDYSDDTDCLDEGYLARRRQFEIIEKLSDIRPIIESFKPSITLITATGKKYVIPFHIAFQAKTLNALICDSGQILNISSIPDLIMEKVQQIFISFANNVNLTDRNLLDSVEAEINKKYKKFLDIKNLKVSESSEILDLLIAFNFLDFQPGLELIVRSIARNETLSNILVSEDIPENIDNTLHEKLRKAKNAKDYFHLILARFYYLLNNKGLIGVAPESYGISIQDLLDYQPQVIEENRTENSLKLNNKHLISLNGITHIPIAQLQCLELTRNNIHDIKQLRKLVELQHLDLSDNQMSAIPSYSLQQLTQLKQLFLNLNKIKEIPSGALSELTQLHSLDLGDNQISTIHEGSLQGLKNLVLLNLANNQIREIPATAFKELKRLEDIYLSYNKLTAIPINALQKLSQLSYLDLNNNLIEEIPNEIKKLLKLKELCLKDNKLKEIKTSVFRKLYRLKHLHLQNNPIEKVKVDATLRPEIFSKILDFKSKISREGFLLVNKILKRFNNNVEHFTGKNLLDFLEKNLRLENADLLELMFTFQDFDFQPGKELIARAIARNNDLSNLVVTELSRDTEVENSRKLKDLLPMVARYYYLLNNRNLPGVDPEDYGITAEDFLDYKPKNFDVDKLKLLPN